MPAHQLVARDLRRSFQDRPAADRSVARSFPRGEHGESVFLCGASGAGKTTLLYTLAGLERPEAGEVEFEGQKLYRGGESSLAKLRNKKMGFVFQGYFLLPELTALENVMLPGMIGRKASREECRRSLQRCRFG